MLFRNATEPCCGGILGAVLCHTARSCCFMLDRVVLLLVHAARSCGGGEGGVFILREA